MEIGIEILEKQVFNIKCEEKRNVCKDQKLEKRIRDTIFVVRFV